jgi:predicted PurR-regulated permease PerM
MSEPGRTVRSRKFTGELRYLQAALVLITVALLLYSVAPVLSPVVLFLLLILLSAPYRGTREHVLLITAASILLVLWLVHALGSIRPRSGRVSARLHPRSGADALERRGMPRWLAVAILVVPVLLAVGLGLAFGLPALGRQAGELIEQVPAALTRLAAWLERTRLRLLELPFIPDRTVASLRLDEARVAAFIQAQQQEILARAWSAMLGVGRGFGFLLTLLGYLVLTPVVAVYLLRDFNRITSRAVTLLPERRRERWLGLAREYDRLLGRFLRGQVVAALIVGVLTWVGLLLLGFPYSGLVGAVAGVFNLVPYLGLVVSVVPVVIIALLSGSFLGSLLKAGIVFGIVQFIDGSITGPRIVGSSVGLHPVWVMLALAVGSFFYGFVGLLLAMPAAVLLKLVVRETLVRLNRAPLDEVTESDPGPAA